MEGNKIDLELEKEERAIEDYLICICILIEKERKEKGRKGDRGYFHFGPYKSIGMNRGGGESGNLK